MRAVGAVVIGRNEGDHLRRCLESLVGHCAAIVYVDSGSSDGSVSLARSLGAEIVELDISTPFTAARARNGGYARLREMLPDISLVQFVDGDCEIVTDWLDRAAAEIRARPDVAVIFGRVRERHPERSIYNRLADLEWNTPIGDVEVCGGIALMRTEAFLSVGGFAPDLVAGEEPELCHRLRRSGWRIFRLDAEMAKHDLDITRLGQWWKRQVRFGYAQLDVDSRHRGGPFAAQLQRARLWTAGWLLALTATLGPALLLRGPVTALALAIVASGPLAQAARAAIRVRELVPSWHAAAAYGAFAVIGKWAEAYGHIRYLSDRAAGRRAQVIQYKVPMAADLGPSPESIAATCDLAFGPGAGGLP